MKIKKKSKIEKITEQEISKRMKTNKKYYHCIGCGSIYEDKNRNIIINNKKIKILSKEFNKYNISSGLCRRCYDEYKNNK